MGVGVGCCHWWVGEGVVDGVGVVVGCCRGGVCGVGFGGG